MTNKNNNVGYTGQTPMAAGAFYAPYIPLQRLARQAAQQLGWRTSLQTMADYYSQTSVTETMTESTRKFMQESWPGPYQIVASTVEDGPVFRTRYGNTPKMIRVEFRLHFDNLADETWWHLKYD